MIYKNRKLNNHNINEMLKDSLKDIVKLNKDDIYEIAQYLGVKEFLLVCSATKLFHNVFYKEDSYYKHDNVVFVCATEPKTIKPYVAKYMPEDNCLPNMKLFPNIRVLYMSPIYEKCLDKFGDYKCELDMTNCYNLLNDHLKHFSNVKRIVLKDCYKLTDDGLKHLSKVPVINLSGCHKITDEGLKHIKHVRDLNLKICNKITHKGISYLENIDVLNLHTCSKICDLAMPYLKNLTVLNLKWCILVTDEGVKNLTKVRKLILDCLKITDNVLPYLSDIHTLSINGCDNLTKKGLKCLKNVKKLSHKNCLRIEHDDI